MSYLICPLGYALVGLFMGVLVAPATQSDGRERREILAMFVTAWPLIGALTLAIHLAAMVDSYWQSWPSLMKSLGWMRWLSGEEWPL
jgi:hypothetical protein